MRMRKNLATVLAVIMAFVFFMVTPAIAGDVLIDAKVQSVTKAVDKNGNSYVRLIIDETRKLKGVDYSTGVPVMAFGDHAAQLSSLKDGDTLKAICAEREYQGRKSYTILKVIPK